MIEWITTVFNAIQSNAIVAGLFGTTLISGLVVYLRNIPKQIFDFLLNYFTITVMVEMGAKQYAGNYNNPAYLPIYNKLASLKKVYSFGKISEASVFESLDLKTSQFKSDQIREINSTLTLVFAPAQNKTYFGCVEGTWVCFSNNVDDANKYKKNYILKMRFFTRSQAKVNQLLYEGVYDSLANNTERYNRLKYNRGDNWCILDKEKIFSQPPFLLTKIQENIYQKFAWFLNSKNKFNKIGKPYHTGFILHGKPGCGKSHFIQKLSEEFDVPIYILNLTEITTDNELVGLLNCIEERAIVLIEDIDRLTMNGKPIKIKKKESHKFKIGDPLPPIIKPEDEDKKDTIVDMLSMSTILNVIDGIYGNNVGLIFVATTNHIERLDSALIRPGRFDYIFEFDYLQKNDICKFVNYNFHHQNRRPEMATIKLRDDICLPMSIITNICFESNTIDECIDKLNKATIHQETIENE